MGKSIPAFESRPLTLNFPLDLRMTVEPRDGGFQVCISALRVTAYGLSEDAAIQNAKYLASDHLRQFSLDGDVSVTIGQQRFNLSSERRRGR